MSRRLGPERLATERLAPEHGPLHRLFEASLLAKGLFAATEALAGLALLATSHAAIRSAVDWLTRRKLIADPDDAMAHLALRLAAGFNASSQHFYAVYLLGHGAVKLAVVLLLARRIAAAYPVAIGLFAAFIA